MPTLGLRTQVRIDWTMASIRAFCIPIASARLAITIVLATSAGAACSSPSNVDKTLSTSAPSSGGSGAGATGGMASGGTGGSAHAGSSGNEGAIDAGARPCPPASTLTPLSLYPNCDGKVQIICVEVPFNVCYCDGTTAFGFGKPVPRRHLGPCTDAERADAAAGVTDAARD